MCVFTGRERLLTDQLLLTRAPAVCDPDWYRPSIQDPEVNRRRGPWPQTHHVNK